MNNISNIKDINGINNINNNVNNKNAYIKIDFNTYNIIDININGDINISK